MNRPSDAMAPGVLGKFKYKSNESPVKILIVATLLCLACAALVSSAAVLLRPLHKANEVVLAKQREILRVAGLYQKGQNISAMFRQIEVRIVELPSGQYAENIDPDKYDYDRAVNDPSTRVEIPENEDIAKIRAIAKYAPVYLVKTGKTITKIVLPVYGYGLWSTMRAYIAIKPDGNTVDAVSFYQHGETPGLGAEISSLRWQAKWKNKLIYDAQGNVKLQVARGVVATTAANPQYAIDGISGATLTINGVTNLMRFWLGANGFGAYLKTYQHGMS